MLGVGDVGWRRCAGREFQMAGALRWNERSEILSLEVAGRDRVMISPERVGPGWTMSRRRR